MPNQTAQLDRVFYALSDPTRRAVLQRLSVGPAAVSELAKAFDMALPSFTQHLNVLSDCGLVHSHKTGRVRTYELSPQALTEAEQWIAAQRAIWETRCNQLDSYLHTLKDKTDDSISSST
ncbi:MAG TPA: metalloregulator ArsR/SmtB family transcription factor [Chroococcidiopsis sp.]